MRSAPGCAPPAIRLLAKRLPTGRRQHRHDLPHDDTPGRQRTAPMAIALAVATACILLAVLIGFGYYTTITQQARERSALRQLCAALYPDFTWPHAGRDTTQTFHLMLSGMAVFGAVL